MKRHVGYYVHHHGRGHRTRAEAIRRMDRALSEYDVAGVRTTIPFCRLVMNSPVFVSGEFDTGFVSDHFDADDLAPSDADVRVALVAAGLEGVEAPAPSGNGAAPAAVPVPSRWARRRYAQG